MNSDEWDNKTLHEALTEALRCVNQNAPVYRGVGGREVVLADLSAIRGAVLEVLSLVGTFNPDELREFIPARG